MPARCTAGPASAPPSRCTSCGIFPKAQRAPAKSQRSPTRHGVRAGSINPNLFQDQIYKYGSLGNPDPAVRDAALEHILDSVEIAARSRQPRHLALVRRRLELSRHAEHPPAASAGSKKVCARAHDRISPPVQRMLVEYKPFEPAFYHTDIADWGMALLSRRAAGPQAKVLVDTGHHYQAQNIEQIVAWLLDRGHARRLPLQRPPLRRRRSDPRLHRSLPGLPHLPRDPLLRVGDRPARRHRLHDRPEPQPQRQDRGDDPDRHHRQELYAKAALVDHAKLADCQTKLRARRRRDLPQGRLRHRRAPRHPRVGRRPKAFPPIRMDAFRQSGYLERITAERAERNMAAVTSYA